MSEMLWLILFGIEFAILGCLFHVFRAVFNLFPDRISDNPAVNIMVSPGYSIEDHFLSVEYDDTTGYYKLDSLHNMKIAAICCFIVGILSLVTTPETWVFMTEVNNWLWNRILHNLSLA